MTAEADIMALSVRVREREDHIKYLYSHLNITYFESLQAGDAKVFEMIKKGNKREAINIYGELHNVGLTEAKRAMELLEARLG
ncbi:MAG TPA: hypothetical protein VNA23_09885 [Anaerolineales bacterium]|nr:hypothetical protein [Anaerolineales bacterium]